jgi:hypothetical protein
MPGWEFAKALHLQRGSVPGCVSGRVALREFEHDPQDPDEECDAGGYPSFELDTPPPLRDTAGSTVSKERTDAGCRRGICDWAEMVAWLIRSSGITWPQVEIGQNHHADADRSARRQTITASRGRTCSLTPSALKNKKFETPGA